MQKSIGASIIVLVFLEIYTFGDPVEGVYNLGIKLLSSSGGRYCCQQLAPITTYAYANVIVFEETPLCTSTVPQGDNAVEEGDEYSMTCSVSYLGNAGWAPKMEWKDDNGVISDVIDNSEEGKLDVTVTRSAAPDHHGFEYSARIHFVAYNGTLPDGTATNIPSFTETHTFDAIVHQLIAFRAKNTMPGCKRKEIMHSEYRG
ncbi:hypothetical protein CAPTEDRAFT_186301 [Capitella teleta]|uniref:Ig-like domain-containing protein n=1 Tax=Capitella teleta TaxID=283909 RepID=R7T3N7_CAPTE|nr:hypothetical protein CAPTEDRAFT_186301 [Capitella teleta]|eukprot:ELT87251.1 hypothetical protein CAPTEDRAFT_186301 [Capitella teleta]